MRTQGFSKKRNLVNNRLYQRQTVRCQSIGNCASSVSDLLATTAQTTAGGTACSRLPWPAVLPGRPHGPTILAFLAWLSLYSPTPPVIFRQRRPNQSTLVLPTAWAATLPHLLVIPFVGLAVVHRPGALDEAWSTWSMNDIHRKWTVRGEADSWVHGRTQGNASLLRAK